MRRQLRIVAVVAVTVAATSAKAGNIKLPQFFNPPPPRAQIADAQIWDPYMLPDVGPYADGTRPRDFLYPPPQATRGRYPNPGTFPRSAPWLRTSAPIDYPNIRKRREAAIRTQVPVPAAPSVQSAQPSQVDE